MAGSKGGGGGGKGGSFTPPANQYGGGYGTGYWNPQPRLPQAPYNPMMDVYGSSQNVMQPMMGYYNQFPAAGSNYRPYQPQPDPTPQYPSVPDPDPAPAPAPGPGRGGDPGGVPINFAGNPFQFPMNTNSGFTGGINPGGMFTGGGMGVPARNPELAAPVYGGYRSPRPDGYPVAQLAQQMPILDAADSQFKKGKKSNVTGPKLGYIKYSQPQPQVAPIADPGFGGYDQNARAMMYGAPSIMFGGFR
jgi:hypothetical protein